jgi:hypothetical protein
MSFFADDLMHRQLFGQFIDIFRLFLKLHFLDHRRRRRRGRGCRSGSGRAVIRFAQFIGHWLSPFSIREFLQCVSAVHRFLRIFAQW